MAAAPELDEARAVALCVAAQAGDVVKLRSLLAAGVPANSTDRAGFSALHRAAAGGSAEAVSALLSKGADATAVDEVRARQEKCGAAGALGGRRTSLERRAARAAA